MFKSWAETEAAVAQALAPEADRIRQEVVEAAKVAKSKGVQFAQWAVQLLPLLIQVYPEIEEDKWRWRYPIIEWIQKLLKDKINGVDFISTPGGMRTVPKKRGPRRLQPGELEIEGIKIPALSTKLGLAMHMFAYMMSMDGGCIESDLIHALKKQGVTFHQDAMPSQLRHPPILGKLWIREQVTENRPHPSGHGRIRKGSFLYTLLPAGQPLVDAFTQFIVNKVASDSDIDWRPTETMPEDYYAANEPVKESKLTVSEVRSTIRKILLST